MFLLRQAKEAMWIFTACSTAKRKLRSAVPICGAGSQRSWLYLVSFRTSCLLHEGRRSCNLEQMTQQATVRRRMMNMLNTTYRTKEQNHSPANFMYVECEWESVVTTASTKEDGCKAQTHSQEEAPRYRTVPIITDSQQTDHLSLCLASVYSAHLRFCSHCAYYVINVLVIACWAYVALTLPNCRH